MGKSWNKKFVSEDDKDLKEKFKKIDRHQIKAKIREVEDPEELDDEFEMFQS